jgi:hypothetical protein
MSAARITSAAEAGDLEAVYAGLKPCSTQWWMPFQAVAVEKFSPVGGDNFETAAGYSLSFTADERGFCQVLIAKC